MDDYRFMGRPCQHAWRWPARFDPASQGAIEVNSPDAAVPLRVNVENAGRASR